MGETSVLAKLGFRSGMTAWAPGRPDALASLLPLPAELGADAPDLLIGFVGAVADVASVLSRVLPHYRRGALLWFTYPKKSGAIRTDISRDQGWQPLQAVNLLPVTQIAIDSDWSALRFRYRDEIKTLTRRSAGSA